jgi:hypothetical protein
MLQIAFLFSLVKLSRRRGDASDRILGLVGKLSMRRGALSWFHDVWT